MIALVLEGMPPTFHTINLRVFTCDVVSPSHSSVVTGDPSYKGAGEGSHMPSGGVSTYQDLLNQLGLMMITSSACWILPDLLPSEEGFWEKQCDSPVIWGERVLKLAIGWLV